jgi:hypothetical protein
MMKAKIIYGHEVLKRISQTGMTLEVNFVRGIVTEWEGGYLRMKNVGR